MFSDYVYKLDRLNNPDLLKDFHRIEKQSEVYYGQVNELNQNHGIGSVLFKNGFCYQGMYENGQMTGMGVSLDPKNIKYIGEHLDGKRHGLGILFLPDGRQYQGNWKDNRFHGQGYLVLPNGHSYYVMTDKGHRFETLTCSQPNEGMLTFRPRNTGSVSHRSRPSRD